MPAPILASAFLIDGGNSFRAIPSSPGRRVEFRANLATIRDERDLIACLRHPGVQVDVEADYVGWIAEKMNACGTAQPPQGEVHLPEGFRVMGEPGQYAVLEFIPTNESGTEGVIEPVIELPDLPEALSGGVWNPPSNSPKHGRPLGSKNRPRE
jgi:hypothetical protein